MIDGSARWVRLRPWVVVAAIMLGVVVLTDLSAVEQFALTSGLSGLALLASSLQRPRGSATPATPSPLRPHVLAASAVLQRLDPVEYRRVELGAPWPIAVVGPTGVIVVGVADGLEEGRRRRRELIALRDAVRERLQGGDSRRELPVELAVVVPGTATGLATAADPDVAFVGVEHLREHLTGGEVLPMPAVDRAFRRLADLSLADAPVLH